MKRVVLGLIVTGCAVLSLLGFAAFVFICRKRRQRTVVDGNPQVQRRQGNATSDYYKGGADLEMGRRRGYDGGRDGDMVILGGGAGLAAGVVALSALESPANVNNGSAPACNGGDGAGSGGGGGGEGGGDGGGGGCGGGGGGCGGGGCGGGG